MSEFCYYRGVLYVASHQWLDEYAQLLRLSMTLEEAYQTLGLSRGASPTEINKAYRAKVMEWHPDRNPDKPDAHQKMVEINIAKDILDGKRRPDFGGWGAAPPPPRRGPDVEEEVIGFAEAVRSARMPLGVQWVATTPTLYDEFAVVPGGDIKAHKVRGYVAAGVLLRPASADVIVAAVYYTHKQIQNAYQDKTWRVWKTTYARLSAGPGNPVTSSILQRTVADVFSQITFPSFQTTPSSLRRITATAPVLSEDLPSRTDPTPVTYADVAQALNAIAVPQPRTVRRERTFAEAVHASYTDLSHIEWRLVSKPYTAYGANHTINHPDRHDGFLAYGVSGDHHVCLYAVRIQHYDDSGAPYDPIYDDDRWEVDVMQFPITKKVDTFLRRTLERLYDTMMGPLGSGWDDEVYRVADGVALTEDLPKHRTGAAMSVTEALTRLPAAFKREIIRVTEEQALAAEPLPPTLKWLFHTHEFVTKGPLHSATEIDTRSAVLACGKTTTHFVFAVIRHVLLNAMSDGTKADHDVFNLKLYTYPIAKAPLSDLATRAINKALDEAQLYQRARFDSMVRPLARPYTDPTAGLKDINVHGSGFVLLVDYLKQFEKQQKAEEAAAAGTEQEYRVEVEIRISKDQQPGYYTALSVTEPPFKGRYFRLTLYINNHAYPVTMRDFQRVAKLRFADTRLDVITLIFGNVKKTVRDRRPLTKPNKGRALCNWMANNLQDVPEAAKEQLRAAALEL